MDNISGDFFAKNDVPLIAIVDKGLMGNLDNGSWSATSIATSVFSLIFWSFGFLRMGTTGMVAQAHGSKNYDEIVNLVFRNIAFVILISLLLIFFQRYIFIISLKNCHPRLQNILKNILSYASTPLLVS